MMQEMDSWKGATSEHQTASEDKEKALLAVAAEKDRIEKEALEQAQRLADSQNQLNDLLEQKAQMELQLTLTKGLEPADKPAWAEDDDVGNCQACRADFDAITRRHHCRGACRLSDL